MTSFGLLFIALSGVSLVLSPRKALPWILGGSIAFPASSVVALGSNGLVPFYTSAVLIVGVMLIRAVRSDKNAPASLRPGRVSLLGFALWSVIITLAGPAVFAGMEVLESRGGTDLEIQDPSNLQHTVSNLAQIIYLLLGITVVHYLARRQNLSPNLPSLGFAVGTTLSTIQYLVTVAGLTWPSEFFSNSPSTRYIDFTPEGEQRFRGIFAEPAQLATFSLVSAVFFMSMIPRSRGRNKFGACIFASLALFNVIQSYTGTGLLGGLMVIGTAVGYWSWRFFIQQEKIPPFAPVVVLIGISVLVLALPALTSSASGLAGSKLDSASFQNRWATATFSLNLAADVWFIGVGLGSNRPSSFIPMMMSCVGILGTVLFLLALFRIMREAWKQDAFRPVVWALIAFFLTKVFGGSSLHEPLMWVCIGVCAYAAWQPVRETQDPAAELGRQQRLPSVTAGSRGERSIT